MTTSDGHSNSELIDALHRAHEDVTSRQLSLLEIVARCDDEELWRHDGARDIADWLAAHLGISHWAAHRWVSAAHALADLPRIREAFECGRLPLDKVVELTRFAYFRDRSPAADVGDKGQPGGHPPEGGQGDRGRPRSR